MGSVYGAAVAAGCLGILDAVLVSYVPAFAGYGIYLAMVLVLLFRPGGLVPASQQW